MLLVGAGVFQFRLKKLFNMCVKIFYDYKQELQDDLKAPEYNILGKPVCPTHKLHFLTCKASLKKMVLRYGS